MIAAISSVENAVAQLVAELQEDVVAGLTFHRDRDDGALKHFGIDRGPGVQDLPLLPPEWRREQQEADEEDKKRHADQAQRAARFIVHEWRPLWKSAGMNALAG